MFRKLLLAVAALLLLPVLLVAQDGKLRGKVTDKESGEALIGANVTVDGTNLGAATDVNGEYVILSVPPGIYTLKVTYIGYSPVTISNVSVNASLTTTQNFTMSSSAVQVQGVEIVAERPLIQRNTTNTIRIQTGADVQALPFRGVQNIIATSAGVVQQGGNLYVRGGRVGEVAYYVDGANVTNPSGADDNGREMVSLIREALQEVQAGARLLRHAGQGVEQGSDLVDEGRDDQGDGADQDADAGQVDDRHAERPGHVRSLQPVHKRVENEGEQGSDDEDEHGFADEAEEQPADDQEDGQHRELNPARHGDRAHGGPLRLADPGGVVGHDADYSRGERRRSGSDHRSALPASWS